MVRQPQGVYGEPIATVPRTKVRQPQGVYGQPIATVPRTKVRQPQGVYGQPIATVPPTKVRQSIAIVPRTMANSISATFTVFVCLLLGVTPLAVARMFEDGTDVFLADSGFCHISKSILICDFQWKLESVYLDEYPACTEDEKCQTIIIQRVHNFYFDTSLCIDLTLKHITKVTLQGESLSDCLSMGLNIQNVTLDFIHDGMTSVYADESHIKQLSFSTKPGHLTVIGSQVDVLSLKDVVGDDTSLKIHSSKIKDFKRLQISGKGRFHLLDSTVEDFPPDSLILDSSKWNKISGVTFNKFDEDSPASIILRNGSDITLEEVKGSVKISSPPCPVISPALYPPTPSTRVSEYPEKQPEGRESEDPKKPPEGTWNETNLEHILGYSSYPWMVTALTGAVIVNFLQACIIIGLLLNKFKRRSHKSLSETFRDLEAPLTPKSLSETFSDLEAPLTPNSIKRSHRLLKENF